jgi:argininosuccinate lyase
MTTSAKTLWGGHFATSPDALMQAINASIGVDKRLWQQDIAGSIAHATMLADCGIISVDDKISIIKGLDIIAESIALGTFTFTEELEDIHLNIEARLTDAIGEAGKRLHTGRSRNDQVATDTRLWVRQAIDALLEQVKALQRALLKRAGEHTETVMPGYTHLQVAQPISLAFHLLAYNEMLERDKGRLTDCRRRLNECPLGAAALAGTSYPINRQQTAELLGFDAPMRNALDAVSARDFALEFLAAASILAVHLSRK